MQQVVSATEARIHLGELMRQAVDNRAAIVVERGGQPHVVILSIGEYRRLQRAVRQQEHWRDMVGEARSLIEVDLSDRELPPPDEVLRQIREE